MSELEEQTIMEMFSVPHSMAKDAIKSAGKDITKISKYVKKQAKKKRNALGVCKLCGRKLTDPLSVSRGYGVECYEKVGVKKKYIDIVGE